MSETWVKVAQDSLTAARQLRRSGRYRSAVNRAYFAVFALVTERLEANGVRFPNGRQAPKHGSLPAMVRANLTNVEKWERGRIANSVRFLYDARIQADYMKSARIGLSEASECEKHAMKVFRRLSQA